jgi:hypothetical protein
MMVSTEPTNFNILNINYDIIPKQFLNYINYELKFFEQITSRKFLIEVSTDRFELKVSKKTEDNNDHSKYHLLYEANNLYYFIKNLLMIREYLIRSFDNKVITN